MSRKRFKLYSFENGLIFKKPSKHMYAGGQLVKNKFKELKMSPKDVAIATGIPKKTIKNFYKGCTYFSYNHLCKILALAQIDGMDYITACNQALETQNKEVDNDVFTDELIDY